MPVTRRLIFLVATLSLLGATAPGPTASRGPVVLAAASLQDALTAAADAWARQGHARPRIAFAASSALARQAIARAPADLFVSADEPWMDAVERSGALRPGSRAVVAGNRLVLVAARTPHMAVRLDRPGELARALNGGRLAMADPASVPAGRYGRAALERLGQWRTVAPRVVRAENVRAALALVERGAAPLGIVYASDARTSRRVRVAALFPPASHPPIRYPIALLRAGRSPDAARFRAFLLSPRGRAIFVRHGFVAP